MNSRRYSAGHDRSVPRRPGPARRTQAGWVLLTALLILAIGASSALVFTDRVELLKLAVILALWAAVAGSFVSVLYRRQSDADQSRVRDLNWFTTCQLDREISARREYELTVESQLTPRTGFRAARPSRRRCGSTARRSRRAAKQPGDLFDTDLAQRPGAGNSGIRARPGRAYADWARKRRGWTGRLGGQ